MAGQWKKRPSPKRAAEESAEEIASGFAPPKDRSTFLGTLFGAGTLEGFWALFWSRLREIVSE